MKTLIIILLKIGEIAGVTLGFIIVTMLIIIIDYHLLNEFIANFIEKLPYNIYFNIIMESLAILCVISLLYGSLKQWIKSNKQLTNKIYKYLKK